MSTENVILPSNIIEISRKTSDLSEIEIKKPSNI